MTTTRFTGCEILGHEELGLVTLSERRGDMAVVHTERGITYICSCREPHPSQRKFSLDQLDEAMGLVDPPCDCEPEGA